MHFSNGDVDTRLDHLLLMAECIRSVLILLGSGLVIGKCNIYGNANYTGFSYLTPTIYFS